MNDSSSNDLARSTSFDIDAYVLARTAVCSIASTSALEKVVPGIADQFVPALSTIQLVGSPATEDLLDGDGIIAISKPTDEIPSSTPSM